MGFPLELSVLRCPKCSAPMVRQTDTAVYCSNDHEFAINSDGIIVLLPELPAHDPRREEDAEFADGSVQAERTRQAPWLWISRFPAVHRFDKELVQKFGPGRFLELGGGSCYASAIVKSTYPDAIVYASDVAVNTLRNKAKPVCALFPRQPDFYVALAAEILPFQDSSIDYIFGELFLHHSEDPSQIVREARRVLRPGGRFVFLEPAVPPWFAWLFQEHANTREAHLHIHEHILTLAQWEKIITDAGVPKSALQVNLNAEYQSNPWFVLGGRVLSRLPRMLTTRFFPVGAVIDYRKPY